MGSLAPGGALLQRATLRHSLASSAALDTACAHPQGSSQPYPTPRSGGIAHVKVHELGFVRHNYAPGLLHDSTRWRRWREPKRLRTQ
eukprot:2595578-Amphidinium_carterae.1